MVIFSSSNLTFRDWREKPSISTIERVKLDELDFPAVTVCTDFATDTLATRTIYNMLEVDDKIESMLPELLKDMKKKLYTIDYNRKYPTPYYGLDWMTDFSPDSVVNTALRKEDLVQFAFWEEGNVYNNLFNKVKHFLS